MTTSERLRRRFVDGKPEMERLMEEARREGEAELEGMERLLGAVHVVSEDGAVIHVERTELTEAGKRSLTTGVECIGEDLISSPDF